MFFTQEDYRKIEKWLQERSIKDTDLKKADPLTGKDLIPLVQDGQNKITSVKELAQAVNLPDFINVTTLINKGSLKLREAINGVPSDKRKLGLAITFHSEKGNWVIYQFNGSNINQWSSELCWKNIIEEAYDELVIYRPDEEDITEKVIDGKSYLKFKDRHTNIDNFITKGKVILRKQIIDTEACAIDDEDHFSNILTQDMVDESNTIYVVRYNFDLNNEIISIPSGSTLVFDGGSFKNGTLTLNGTRVIGATNYNEVGSPLNISGSFAVGQIMTFTEGNVTHIKWYSGTMWIELLDIRSWNMIQNQIADVIKDYNAKFSQVNNNISNLESSLNQTNSTVNNISNSLNDLRQEFNNLERDFIGSVTSVINDYLSTNEVGVTSIIVNGKEYTVDENHKITINDLAASSPGSLIIKTSAGDVLGEYNGSEGVEVILPESSGSGESVAGKALTIKDSKGNTLATYTGETEKSVTIPPAGSITFRGISDTDVVYNGVDNLIVNIPSSQSGGGGGYTKEHVGVLFAGTLKRAGRVFYISSSIQTPIGDPFDVKIFYMDDNPRMEVSFIPRSNVATYTLCAASSQVALYNRFRGDNIDSYTGIERTARDFVTVHVQTHINRNKINMVGWVKNNDNKRAMDTGGFCQKDRFSEVHEIYLVVYGSVTFKS